jgi:DHA2 family multidrug resistance protein
MAAGMVPLTGGTLWLAALVLAAANFMAVLDMTVANVSVPSIAGNLGATTSQGTWVITSYAVAEAITVPLTGWLAARFGAVRVFATAMGLFGLASLLCGLANSLGMLVFARILQGLAGGPLMPLSQSLLLRIFPPRMAPAAIGLWSMTTLIAPVLGPIVGGWICDEYTWHWIFLINIPVALVCAFAVWHLVRRYEQPLLKNPIDTVGLILLIVWVGRCS